LTTIPVNVDAPSRSGILKYIYEYENSGTQKPSQHSNAENLVPINSGGTSSGTSTPTLSRCNTLDEAVDSLIKSITLMKSYAKPKRSMTYGDSSASRASSVSSIRHISNPVKASNAIKASSASNAGKASSNAGKASSTSYSSKRRDSFLSVNQPTSDASSDSEAGKSRSTGKASSTSYSSKRQEETFLSVKQPKISGGGASSDSVVALEKGNFTWYLKLKLALIRNG